jgi:hypothetical protein
LLASLLVASKWEFIGGIIFTAIGIVMSPFIFLHNYNVNHFSIADCIKVMLANIHPAYKRLSLFGFLFLRTILPFRAHRVCIKVRRDIRHSTLYHYFAFVVN